MGEIIKIVVVDDQPLMREGISYSLSRDPGLEVVGEGENCDDAVRLANELSPDIILLDISMPGGGVKAAQLIARQCPSVVISMLTVSEKDDDVLGSLRAGAVGYILKGIGGSCLIEIVRALASGKSYVSPELADRLDLDPIE